MVFRFFKFNPLNKTLISRISSYTRYNANPFSFRNPLIIQALNPSLFDYPITNPENPNFKIPKRWHVGLSGHHHHHQHDQSTVEGEKIFRLGLAADISLATAKALTGYLSGSTAIIADAAHSLSDVVLSGVALLSFKASRVPKDKEHPYGHF